MAKAWLWVLVAVVGLMALVWVADYWYNYYTTGICRDDRGNSYFCGKAYRYSSDYGTSYNSISYSYLDNYGNNVVIEKSYDFDDYYDCAHARNPDSRYGELLREDYGIRCRGYEVVSDNTPINDYYSNNYYPSSEKAPLIYVK